MGTYDEIYATFGGTKGQLVVVSADPDEARARARADAVAEVAEGLAATGTIEGFDALGTIAPSDAAQRVRLELRDALDLPSGMVGALGSVAGLVCALVIIPAGFRVWMSRSLPGAPTRS
jgi:hypothetical protein